MKKLIRSLSAQIIIKEYNQSIQWKPIHKGQKEI